MARSRALVLLALTVCAYSAAAARMGMTDDEPGMPEPVIDRRILPQRSLMASGKYEGGHVALPNFWANIDPFTLAFDMGAYGGYGYYGVYAGYGYYNGFGAVDVSFEDLETGKTIDVAVVIPLDTSNLPALPANSVAVVFQAVFAGDLSALSPVLNGFKTTFAARTAAYLKVDVSAVDVFAVNSGSVVVGARVIMPEDTSDAALASLRESLNSPSYVSTFDPSFQAAYGVSAPTVSVLTTQKPGDSSAPTTQNTQNPAPSITKPENSSPGAAAGVRSSVLSSVFAAVGAALLHRMLA